MKHPTFTSSDLLAAHSRRVCALVERIRAIILKAIPGAAERANRGWHALTYHHPLAGYVCGIFPQAERVCLVFEFGVLLPDPDGILTGDGKQVRTVIIARPGEIRVRALRALIAEALALPYERAERMQLIAAAAEHAAGSTPPA